MSKIKPNTWLPLFGVETDWLPPPKVFTSRPYPLIVEPEGVSTGADDHIAGRFYSWPQDFAESGADILEVVITGTPDPIELHLAPEDAAQSFADVLGVTVVTVGPPPPVVYNTVVESAQSSAALVGVTVVTVLITYSNYPVEAAASAGADILGVTVT